MLSFSDTSAEFPGFAFRYEEGYSKMKFKIFEPFSLDKAEYDALSKGVFINPYDKTSSRRYNFAVNGEGLIITVCEKPTLNDNAKMIIVTFEAYPGSSKLKFSLPFRLCQKAFEQAANWFRVLTAKPITIPLKNAILIFTPGIESRYDDTISLSWEGGEGRDWYELKLDKEAWLYTEVPKFVTNEPFNICFSHTLGQNVRLRLTDDVTFLIACDIHARDDKAHPAECFSCPLADVLPGLQSIVNWVKSSPHVP